MDNPRVAEGQAQHRSLELSVPCRKCETCLYKRMRLWAGRGSAEITFSERTWFCTFTLRPSVQDWAKNIARQDEHRNGRDFDGLSSSEQFAGRLRPLSSEMTKFLKRLRKGRENGIRHLVVAEAFNKRGELFPHFHGLLHHTKETLVTYRNIADEWKHLGFLQANLVPMEDHRPAFYVCKYLSKSADARVRASLHYGTCNIDLDHMKF